MNSTQTMNLYDIHSEIEDMVVTFEEACSALDVLYESMEAEGFQQREDFHEWKAVNFAHRFPMYLSTYRVIQRDLKNTVKLLELFANQIFEAYAAQKETTA